MLQQIREHSSGWISRVVIGVIVVVFALFGLENLGSLFSGGSSKNDVATVNGDGISRQSLDEQVMRLAQSGNLPPERQEQARGQILDQLIQQKLLDQYATKGGMTVSDNQVDQLILNLPQFKSGDGKFSTQQFVERLRQIGYTPDTFRDYLKRDLTTRQLQNGLVLGSFATSAERERITALSNETRDFRYAVLDSSNLTAPVEASDEELHHYYDQHKEQYVRPEQARLDYLVLDKSALAKNVSVSDSDLRAEYANQAKDAARQVSDIVISEDDTQQAKERMQQVQQQLDNGASFASVARQFSDDKASASNGGDLGNVTSGIFGEPFDSTVAGLDEGEVSKPFEFDGALHLVKVTGIDMPSFDELKPQITERLQLQKVNSAFDSAVEELGDKSFSADNLDGVAQDMNLPLQHSDWVSKESDSVEGVLSEPGVLDAAFASDVLNNGYNSDVLDLGNDRRLVLHVNQHREQQQLPFDQVEDQVRQAVIAEKTRTALNELAQQRVASLKQGEQVTLGWRSASQVSRDADTPDSAIINRVFALPRPEQGNHSFGIAELGGNRVAVLDLASVGTQSGKGDEGKVANTIRDAQGNSVSKGLLDLLNERATIERQ
ncbi:SurA N-terminal domain-containing protein [Carnimonas nigrificans]|uniref:SurA N-terminal domain-containing protein n=1 Tax=Carnimonas nigrificans TaxID=64323 RepID=UPI0004710A2D|nr:SurA N-terminal domain-containing protein [Carnimonas nigrificans]